jgi:hypothetical protein
MPAISKIRLTNVVYEEGNKRYNDEIFLFDGHNGAILLENGGGKTVFIQTALQAILPHADLADRKIKNTLMLENAPAHIAIEWIANDQPRRYVVTAVSLFTNKQGLDSLRYVYDYNANDPNGIEGIPFVREGKEGKRTAERGEMLDYYSHMREKSFSARTFSTIKDYKSFIEEQYHIISGEWESIAKINSSEGGVEAFFDECKSTNQLFDRLLIPTVESSIVGHDAQLFADMFEQQHTSFKNYKKLKETIEENKQIETQLNDYANTYEKLHNRELEYEKVKQRAKGAWNETIKEKQKFTAEQMNTLEELEEWKTSHHAFKVKTASYEIFAEKFKFKMLEKEYKESFAKMINQEESLEKHKKDYYSLKLAELKLFRKEQVDLLRLSEDELSKFEQKEEVADYEDHLEKAKQALLGWFVSQLEGLEKEKQAITFQLNPILSQIEQAEKSKGPLAEAEKNLSAILSRTQGVISSRLKDLERLKQQLLSNPDQEQVKDILYKWQERTQFLDEEIIRLQQEIKQLYLQEQEIEERKEEFQKSRLRMENDLNRISYKLSSMEKAQRGLIEKLAGLRPQWTTLENVYLTQESVETRLIETIEKLTKDKDQLLYRERLAYRFQDDYGKQELFFGDPYLEKQLSSWKNQFDYLVTGIEYLQTMESSRKNELLSYPLWPITLVTTSKMKNKLMEKVNHIANQIQFPITVITTEEALSIHEQLPNLKWVSPSHWSNNIEPNSFQEWKDQIGAFAEEVTMKRVQKEKEIKKWEDGLNAFNQFLNAFPYDEVANLNEQQSERKNHLDELKAKIQSEKKATDKLRLKMSQFQKVSDQYREEKQGLEWKLEKGIQYLQIEKEIEEENQQEKETNERLLQVTRELKRLNRQIVDLNQEKTQLHSRISDLDAESRIIAQDEEYQLLKSLSPLFTNESKKSIKDKMLTLEMKIREIKVAQGEWLAKRDAAKEMIQRLDLQLNELLIEHSYVDETRDFPGDGKHLLKTLWNQMNKLRDELEKLEAEVKQKGSVQDQQKGKWETKLEQFKRDFPNETIITFDQSLEEIVEQLGLEKGSLIERKAYLTQELTRIEKELGAIEEAKLGLDLFEEGHHFNAPDIAPLSLNTEETISFTYNRKGFVQRITDELKTNKSMVEAENKEVERAKRKFREFCINQISDMKLQQMAINGVEHKHSYREIMEFKKNMMMRIEKISHYANEHIRKSDEDLQLFINQIHSHLLTLVEELKQIPKKTKVKVADDWKQIFTFTIPEWEEEIGKMRIRDYIEWILQQLESERFLNEQGIQDDRRVRKEIEMWLQSKQLLQMVMNNEVMKVSCRKVTNDNKVTTRSYSWEQSNVWSGGEKWSKNMTLFLGILNYVAEKKKHIQSNMKRHRAVILDNPFGKASSDHVLSPVFFVAEQLGFQIIALTAHAEGKFLQDYFPVIYSCRLRESTDSGKKIMTKEKWLHHAYFQDHEPKAIDRLGETEQMVLFE